MFRLYLAFIAIPLLAQQDARDLLHRVVTTFQSAKTVHLEYESESEMIGEMHRSWTKNRQLYASDTATSRVRLESILMSGAYFIVSDGKTLWRANANTRQFLRVPVTGPLLAMKGGGGEAEHMLQWIKFATDEFPRLEQNILRAEQIGTASVEMGTKSIDCAVIRVDYAPPRGFVGSESIVRTFWIDPLRNLILKDEIESRGKFVSSSPFEHNRTIHRRRYLTASIDEPLADSLFTYTPPANFREVDRLERQMGPPKVDLVGKPAPDLTLLTLTSDTVELKSLRGKIVLLDFWATWCAPCRAQMPSIAKLQHETKDRGVIVLGIDDDRLPETALTYMKEKGYNWPSLFDGDHHDARDKFKIDGIPTLVLIDQQGKIVAHEVGSGESADLAIRAALQKLGVTLH